MMELKSFSPILQGSEAPSFVQEVLAGCRWNWQGSDTSLKNKGKGELSTSVMRHCKIEVKLRKEQWQK